MHKNRAVIFITAFVFLGLAVYISFNLYPSLIALRQIEKRKAAWVVLDKKVRQEAAAFGQEVGVVIKDLTTGWKISINEVKLFPSASLVKVPIMASYAYASAQKKLDLNRGLILEERYKVLGSGILKEYAPGTEFNIKDLIELMVAESDNTAANMLIEYAGFDSLNGYFKKLGLGDTNLVRKMMDFKSRREGLENFTTAHDQALLLEKIYYNRLVDKDVSQKCLDTLKKQKIRDRIPARLPPDIIVAHKTGLENGICHDAGIIFTPRGDLLICVLTKHNYKFARPAKKFISQVSLDAYNYCLLNS